MFQHGSVIFQNLTDVLAIQSENFTLSLCSINHKHFHSIFFTVFESSIMVHWFFDGANLFHIASISIEDIVMIKKIRTRVGTSFWFNSFKKDDKEFTLLKINVVQILLGIIFVVVNADADGREGAFPSRTTTFSLGGAQKQRSASTPEIVF
jgi:hypothetical protein